jgi:sugar O-acyltransferase (sialic acid O-acetyltransferase NeuD family)
MTKMGTTIMNIVLYGAGGHGKTVLAVIKKTGDYRVLGLIDDHRQGHVLGVPILGPKAVLPALKNIEGALVTIGHNLVRAEIAAALTALDIGLVTVIDRQAMIAEDVVIGAGTVVMPGAIINPGTRIGRNVIINSGSIIEHDCLIEDHVHIAPGARLAGGVTVRTLAQVGIGATVIENISIGAGSVVGAGAVVVDPIKDHALAVGVPAKIIRELV